MALIEGIAALVAKVASASTVAQATAGLGIAVAGVTGAGAAGVLPGPVQDTVAGAVEAVTPFELPHSAADASAHPRTTVENDAPVTVVPTTPIVVPPTAAPTTEADEQETEVEHGADGTHQHRGGRTATTRASSDDSPATAEAPEVEDDHESDDSGSASDDSGHGGDSGSDSGHDDGSGHGGDD